MRRNLFVLALVPMVLTAMFAGIASVALAAHQSAIEVRGYIGIESPYTLPPSPPVDSTAMPTIAPSTSPAPSASPAPTSTPPGGVLGAYEEEPGTTINDEMTPTAGFDGSPATGDDANLFLYVLIALLALALLAYIWVQRPRAD